MAGDLRAKTIEQCYQVPGQTWPVELGWLYDNISLSQSHAEIGVYCGRSLLASCGGMKKFSEVVAVDDGSEWGNRQWVGKVQSATLELIHPNISINNLRMNSIDAARECQRLNHRFDSVFIDGNHHYAECKADIQAWMALLKPGGLICGHDYWPVHIGVMDAVNEVFGGRHSVISGTRIWCFRV